MMYLFNRYLLDIYSILGNILGEKDKGFSRGVFIFIG